MKITKLLTQQLTRIGLAAVLVSTLNLQLSTARAQGTGFTYQGVLNDGGTPATGLYDLEFRAFDAVSGGAQQAGTVTANDVPVTNGLFTTTLDFGAAVFTGPARWLNIAVRPGAGVGAYASLLPRQPITASPYAVFAGGTAAAGLTGTLPDARLSANVALRSGGNAFTGNQSVMSGDVGIGTTSPFTQLANTPDNIYGSDGYGLSSTSLGWVSSGFGYAAGFYNSSTFVGGDGVTIGIAGIGTANRILDIWSGGASNSVMVVNGNGNVGIGTNTPGAKLHVSGNGTGEAGNVVVQNSAAGDAYASIRLRNNAGSDGIIFKNSSTRAGNGGANTMTVRNDAGDLRLQSVGGNGIMVKATTGNVGIGTASPLVPLEVRVTNGRNALLSGQGGANFSFYDVNGGGGNPYLWDISGDTNAFAIAISGVGYPFLIKKSNGYVGINNTAPTAPLHVGGEAKATVFTPTSDRNAKQDFTPVNPREILEKVVALPITEWTYKTIAGARHMGPVAQDFRAAFGLGSDDKGISTVDADGVALASIQALNEKLNEKDAEVQELKQSVEELKELVRSLAKKQ